MISLHRALEHRSRAVVALVALAVVAVVLAACGSSGKSASSDPQALLKQTFSGSHKITSGQLNLALGLDIQGDQTIKGPVKLTLTGPFQSQGAGKLPQFDMNANLAAQGSTFQVGLALTGDKAFIKYGGVNYAVPPAVVTQLQQNYEKGRQQGGSSKSAGNFGIEPLKWLKDPTNKGTETIGGTETEHISASLDAGAFLDDINTFLAKAKAKGLDQAAGRKLPGQLTAQQRQEALKAIKSSSVDIWTGNADTTLRKLAVTLNLASPKSGQTGAVTFSIEFDDLNKPQTITAPATSQPLSGLLSQFQGLLGSIGGGAASGGASSGSGSSSTSQIDKYTNCLKQANGDMTKVQKCEPLLGK